MFFSPYPIKDDIGDKSVFMFNALPEEEKKALIQKLEQQNNQELDWWVGAKLNLHNKELYIV